MAGDGDVFLRKAEESLAGAESELANRRFNNCANRCYYACYQAAVGSLLREGIRPSGDGQWSHAAVQAQFSGLLINRRKRYPSDLRDTLSRAFAFRQTADYETESISEIQAERLMRRTRAFLVAVQQEN